MKEEKRKQKKKNHALCLSLCFVVIVIIIYQKELKLVKEDNSVYKLIGPVLVKQDIDEAKSNVEKRVDYIQNEL